MRYDKRHKEVHRYTIADTRGTLTLTVPVSRPSGVFETGKLLWKDVTVSAHGRWWEVHRIALESAYGRTPFFEYYIDRFKSLFAPRPLEEKESIVSLCLRADKIVREILGMETKIVSYIPENSEIHDFRTEKYDVSPCVEYWQVRRSKLGFISGMSILDLIFNMGTEAPLYLM